MRDLENKMYSAQIGQVRGWKKQLVAYYICKVEKAGLIHRVKRSNIVDYEITSEGQNFLASCEGALFSSGVFRLHHCFFKYPILREGSYPFGGFRSVEMVNWTALLGLEQGGKVRKTPSNWIVHMPTMYGRSPEELVTSAKNLADRVSRSLMSKYGCVLGEGKIGKRYELGIDDPVANFLNRYFTVSTPKRVIDDSPGEDEGELDHLGRDAAVEYLLMPERVKKLECRVDEALFGLEKITKTLEKMGCDLSKVADTLGKLTDFDENAQEASKSFLKKDFGYVS